MAKEKTRKRAAPFSGPSIPVTANRPVTLYEDANVFVFYATEKDVLRKTVFEVPDTHFWQHKIVQEKILSFAPVEVDLKEQEEEEKAEVKQ